MTQTWVDVDRIEVLKDREIWPLARAEYIRMLAVLVSLNEGDWAKPTDCSAWTIRDMLGHLVGAAEGFGNPLELIHQYRSGARLIREGRTDGKQDVDGANAVQVAERAGLSVPELVARFEAAIEPALRWRRRLRRLPGSTTDNAVRFSLRQLFEVILTRDIWMHRLDIARATGRPFELTADHDQLIIADVVRDWAGQHGQLFRLVLTGPAGGAYRRGESADQVELDAVEYCRLLSGRGRGEGLLATRVVW